VCALLEVTVPLLPSDTNGDIGSSRLMTGVGCDGLISIPLAVWTFKPTVFFRFNNCLSFCLGFGNITSSTPANVARKDGMPILIPIISLLSNLEDFFDSIVDVVEDTDGAGVGSTFTNSSC